MRQLFRTEYARELEEITTALSSEPMTERDTAVTRAEPNPLGSDRPSTPPPLPPTPSGWSTGQEPQEITPPPDGDDSEPKKEGFWSRIMRRKR